VDNAFNHSIAMGKGWNVEEKRDNLLLQALYGVFGAVLGVLLIALGLDYLYLGKTLSDSLERWSSSFIGCPVGIFVGTLIGGIIRRRRTEKTRQN